MCCGSLLCGALGAVTTFAPTMISIVPALVAIGLVMNVVRHARSQPRRVLAITVVQLAVIVMVVSIWWWRPTWVPIVVHRRHGTERAERPGPVARARHATAALRSGRDGLPRMTAAHGSLRPKSAPDARPAMAPTIIPMTFPASARITFPMM